MEKSIKTFKITLPWWPAELKPNGNNSTHWTDIAKAKKLYKQECYYIALGKRLKEQPSANIALSILFYPKTNRARDLDNCLASIKAGLDGVAQALGVNDKLFRPITIDFGPVDKKRPRVEIEFTL